MKIITRDESVVGEQVSNVTFGSAIALLGRPDYWPGHRAPSIVKDESNVFILTSDYYREERSEENPDRRMLQIVHLPTGRSLPLEPFAHVIVLRNAEVHV